MGKASNVVRLEGVASKKVREGMKLLEERAAIESLPKCTEAKGLKLAAWKGAFCEYAKRYGMMSD